MSGAKEKGRKEILPLLALGLVALGVLLRFYRLGLVPYGLHQDEASIGYDAFLLWTSGVDRNGYPWPVYPVTWGSGGGSPLMIYLAVITTALFGKNPFSLRLSCALLGALTLPVFYELLRRGKDDRAGLAGLFLLTVSPWGILLSRWCLDGNVLPFFLALAMLFFLRGAQTQKTWRYLCAAAFFGLTLYCYGSTTLVIPLFLLGMAWLLRKRGLLSWKQLALSVAVFLAVALPLLVFYLVNFLSLPEIVTPWFSVPHLTAKRALFYPLDAELPGHMWESFRYMLRFFTIGSKDTEIICTQVPGFGLLYRFTFPLTALGVAAVIRKRDLLSEMFLLLAALSVAFSLFIELDNSRMVLFMLPLLYLEARGLLWLWERYKPAGAACAALLCCALLLFCRDYFGSRYAEASAEGFMAGYADAVAYADSIVKEGRTVYSTYEHVAAPFMVALYATGTPGEAFRETVVYRDAAAEFRIATSFTHFVFGLPEDIRDEKYREDVLVLWSGETEAYEAYDLVQFGDYAVAVPAPDNSPRHKE